MWIYQIAELKYVKQKTIQLKVEIDKSIIIVGDFYTLFSTIDNWTSNQQGYGIIQHHQPPGSTDIYKTLHPTPQNTHARA